MKISDLIFVSIFFVLILFSFTTFINYKQSEEVRDNAEFFAVSSNVMRQINQLQRNILYMERGLRGYAMTGENYFLQAYDSAYTENAALIGELSVLLPANSTQLDNLQAIENLYDAWLAQFAAPLIAASQVPDSLNTKLSTNYLYQNNQLVQNEEKINKELQGKFRELQNVEYANRAERKLILESSERQTKVISFSLTILSIIIGLVIAIVLVRHIARRILKMVGLANDIAAGNYQVQVEDTGKDELSNLVRSLNRMANTLAGNISLLKRKNQELDKFAHIVSHDLKAPLRGIDNVIAWIEEDYSTEIPPKVGEYLQIIKGRIKRLENLIQGILTYARIGREVQVREDVDLNQLLEEVLENLPMKPGIDINVQPDLPVIRSEKLPLQQVFTNLIDNAIKYHDKPNGTIKIYSRSDRNQVTFFVEDDGPGIADSYHEKIFVIFQTLQERDSFESTGVGLAIVKKILDDRNEQINVYSESGKGAIFSFTWSKI